VNRPVNGKRPGRPVTACPAPRSGPPCVAGRTAITYDAEGAPLEEHSEGSLAIARGVRKTYRGACRSLSTLSMAPVWRPYARLVDPSIAGY